MEITVIRGEPTLDAFLPRHEYEAQTPAIFQQFDTSPNRKPVLYNHVAHAEMMIAEDFLKIEPLFTPLTEENPEVSGSRDNDGGATPHESWRKLVRIPVSLWVNADNLTIFSARRPYGIQIPYEFICHHGYHALDSPTYMAQDASTTAYAVLIEMITRERAHDLDDDDDVQWPSFELIPSDPNDEGTIKALYQAIADCMDLHPDPQSPDEGDEGPVPALGSGTWITAENMDEYADQFADSSEGLGPGAGTVHARDDDGHGTNGVGLNGEHEDAEEEEETKWQRTG